MAYSEGAEQAIQLVEEITTVLYNPDDQEFKNFEKVQEVDQQLTELREKRNQNTKTSIQALIDECSAEEDTLKSTSIEELEADLAEMSASLKQSTENREQVEKRLQQLETERKQSEQQKAELEKLRQQLEQQKTQTLPSVRHDINLYSYITGIRWQYDCEPHEVKGYIASKKKVKTFDLNSKVNSQFFIANYLWDQMETDW